MSDSPAGRVALVTGASRGIGANGQILFNDGSNEMGVFTAGGTPNPAGTPTITHLSATTLAPGGAYSLSGTQLAVPDDTPTGPSTLVPVANGIASAPSTVTIP